MYFHVHLINITHFNYNTYLPFKYQISNNMHQNIIKKSNFEIKKPLIVEMLKSRNLDM